MLNVMGDETASLARRDAMAVASAAYCHPKLTAVSVSNHGGREGGGDVSITQIFAIPRGALIDRSGKVTTLEGTAVEIQPFEPTPALVTDQSQPAPLEPIAEPLPVQLIDVSNVTILRRRDDDDPSSGGA